VQHIPVLGKKLEVVKILIHTNQNFKDMLNYIKDEIPLNAKIYELSNNDLGISDETWRFWSLKDRAEKVKVMNIDDTIAMLKVLGRYDLSLKSTSTIDKSKLELQSYFLNTLE